MCVSVYHIDKTRRNAVSFAVIYLVNQSGLNTTG